MSFKSSSFCTMLCLLSVLLIGGCNEFESANIVLNSSIKKTAPVIVEQPQSVDKSIGDAAVFFVKATGDNLRFQWKKDGVGIIGATIESYTIPAVNIGDAKSKVSVVVQNDAGSTESEPASVFVHKMMPSEPLDGYLTQGQAYVSDLLKGEKYGSLTVSVVSGPEMKVQIGDDNIVRYLSPVEQYTHTVTTLAFQDVETGVRYFVPMPWSSKLGPLLFHSGESKGDPSSLKLITDGDTRYGYINESVSSIDYTFKAHRGMGEFDLQVYLESSSDTIQISEWFDVNPGAGKISLKKEYLPQFLKSMKELATISLEFILFNKDNHTYGFGSVLQYANTQLIVKMVDGQGNPDLTVVGKEYVVRGIQTDFTELVKVDESGELKVKNIPVDNYSVSEVRLDSGFPKRGFAPFGKGATTGVLYIVTSNVSYEKAVIKTNSFKDDGEIEITDFVLE